MSAPRYCDGSPVASPAIRGSGPAQTPRRRTAAAAPAIMAAIAAPVAGPVVKPICWLPKASQRPRMPRRGPDHRQAVRQGRPRAAPGVADRLAEFDHAARQRHHRVDLREGRRRIAVGQFDARGDADAVLHRRHQESALGVMDRTQQLTRRVRLELAVIAALGRQRHAIAERPQQIRRPRPERDHDMARAQSRHPTSTTRQPSPSGTIDLMSDWRISPPAPANIRA